MRYLNRIFTLLFLIIITLPCYSFTFPFFHHQEQPTLHLTLTKTAYDDLPNWEQDDHRQALSAFKQSCTAIMKLKSKQAFSNLDYAGDLTAWQHICRIALRFNPIQKLAAQRFFENWFQPYLVASNYGSVGLFTGYYLPILSVSLKRSNQFPVPIYGLPDDLVKVKPRGYSKAIVMQVRQNHLYPYPDRAAINQGAIVNHAPILFWAKNEIDVFFAQIQGSAVAELPNHQRIVISYAGDNGRPYTSVGRILLDNNILSKENISMQTIREWLDQHPEQKHIFLNQNASYVFFRIVNTKDPLGTQQIPLTPGRTLAVDTHFIPLGAPVWLSTTVPTPALLVANNNAFNRLLIAQDTGGAIKGMVRGDIYWGTGDDAAYRAGHMRNAGEYWVLLPRKVAWPHQQVLSS